MDGFKDMKFYLFEFGGIMNINLYLEWIKSFERFFEVMKYSEEKGCTVAVLKFKKYASLFYEKTKRQRAKNEKS